jgi:hypothetical protein
LKAARSVVPKRAQQRGGVERGGFLGYSGGSCMVFCSTYAGGTGDGD